MKLNPAFVLVLAVILTACYEPLPMAPDLYGSKAVAQANTQLVQPIINVGLNSSFTNSAVRQGTVNAKIGSYTLSNTSNEYVEKLAFVITADASFSNLGARIICKTGWAQIYPTLSLERYEFSLGRIIFPPKSIITVDIFANVSANAVSTTQSATSWVSFTGVGMITGDTVLSIGNPKGQIITITR